MNGVLSSDRPVRGFLFNSTHVHHSIILFKIAEVTFVIGICSSLRSVGLSCWRFSSMPATIFDCLIISKSTFNSTPSEAMRVTDILGNENHGIIRVISVLKNCSNWVSLVLINQSGQSITVEKIFKLSWWLNFKGLQKVFITFHISIVSTNGS